MAGGPWFHLAALYLTYSNYKDHRATQRPAETQRIGQKYIGARVSSHLPRPRLKSMYCTVQYILRIPYQEIDSDP
jgi:hypothetical protein